ncbi:MAG TPA: ribosomal protein S18-alanine N-acetyltransferase [candidate division Zixibacteria bacterium]|nr:ribosomal protein S18-alanine N-acetyltransferase [candidate division Zixibacteria bacterium]
MLKPPHPYRLRPMRLSDITSVMRIERTSFPVPWKESAYHYEVAENRIANYQVLTVTLADLPEKVIGYAGFWMLIDEAHISTIAVTKNWRRRGLGKLLILNLLNLAYKSEAEVATLEVRKSNTTAQALYRSLRFEIAGGKRRYYQGREDAIIMSVKSLDRPYRSFLHRTEKELFQRLRENMVGIDGL